MEHDDFMRGVTDIERTFELSIHLRFVWVYLPKMIRHGMCNPAAIVLVIFSPKCH